MGQFHLCNILLPFIQLIHFPMKYDFYIIFFIKTQLLGEVDIAYGIIGMELSIEIQHMPLNNKKGEHGKILLANYVNNLISYFFNEI